MTVITDDLPKDRPASHHPVVMEQTVLHLQRTAVVILLGHAENRCMGSPPTPGNHLVITEDTTLDHRRGIPNLQQ